MEKKIISWPEERIASDAVRIWIGEQLSQGAEVEGPVEVYRANAWGVTARFSAKGQDVVAKVGFLPIFKHSPAVYELLKRAAPAHVPNLLASKREGEQTWMLFAPFAGETVREVGTLEALLDMARTTGKVQAAAAEVLKTQLELPEIPRVSVADVPALFESLMKDVREKYLMEWQTKAESIAQDFGLSLQSVQKIADVAMWDKYKVQLDAWCAELQEGAWPESVYHIDLHTGNGARKPDGDTLIFDWEEATISCPFFAVEKLLEDVRRFDKPDVKVTRTFNGVLYTEKQLDLRAAYLSRIPWGTQKEKERAFDVALCLAPIKYAYQSTFFLTQVGWGENAAGFIAESMVKAMERWEAYKI